jgi:thiamine-phosphate pyrophosphorylase
MKEMNIHIPLVAIGGICKGDIPELLQSGVNGIALSGSILHADDPIREMEEIVEILKVKQLKY